ncbi:MAG: branched-chain amino acid ABC transporter substrate-binding protein [Rhodocyclaceae bacterium]
MACEKEPPKKDTTPTPTPGAEAGAIVVKIGHAAPLTGPQSHLGKDNENGARLAIEDANAKAIEIGGKKVKFELLGEDDQADPKQGTLVAQKLVDAKINAMVGHLNSGTTIPASKIYSDAGIPQVSPSATNPKYTQQGFKTAFRVMANDVQQGRALGSYAVTTLGAKRIAIIDDRTAYGQGVADEVEKAVIANGGEIVAREFTTDKSTDFAAILTKVKATNPEVLFFGGMDAQGGPMAKQMQTLGLATKLGLYTKLLMADGGCTTEFHKLAGPAAEGAYCSLPGVPLDKMPGGTDFKNRYKAKFNTDIQLYAPYVYDAVGVIIDAMKRANSVEPAVYLPALAKTDGFQGVTAKIQFDDKGDIKDGDITLYQAANGKWDPRDTLGGSTAAAPAATPEPKGEPAKDAPKPSAEAKAPEAKQDNGAKGSDSKTSKETTDAKK